MSSTDTGRKEEKKPIKIKEGVFVVNNSLYTCRIIPGFGAPPSVSIGFALSSPLAPAPFAVGCGRQREVTVIQVIAMYVRQHAHLQHTETDKQTKIYTAGAVADAVADVEVVDLDKCIIAERAPSAAMDGSTAKVSRYSVARSGFSALTMSVLLVILKKDIQQASHHSTSLSLIMAFGNPPFNTHQSYGRASSQVRLGSGQAQR